MYHKWIKEYGKTDGFFKAYKGVTGAPFGLENEEGVLTQEDFLQILEDFRMVILKELEVDIDNWDVGVFVMGLVDFIPKYIEVDNAVILEFQVILSNFLLYLEEKDYLENVNELIMAMVEFMPVCLNRNLDTKYWSSLKRKNIESYMEYMDDQMEMLSDLLDDLEETEMSNNFFPITNKQPNQDKIIPMKPSQVIPFNAANKKMSNKIYQLRIDIVGAKPPIWRRVLVPAEMTFEDLHEIIQTAFDWDTAHLYQFTVGNIILSDFEAEELLGEPTQFYFEPKVKKDMAKTKLSQLINLGDKFEYIYDFGDSWEHKIVVEEILDRDSSIPFYPYCTKGKRTAPFEDFGGIERFDDFVASFKKNANKKSVQDVLEWAVGEDIERYHPDQVDIEEINEILSMLFFE
ncbi:plasmid pRiA4b ORF-3 family protein [Vagococcus carniphilus]|uniref:plasmid pRiA4b ORF-3 family protein n=1 Tax=Vagococcus carniphilus TaxID=218144 RepID=UPI00289213F9|nr:plasmid pRiA4b ORF-3 family protein [Vagococcus carniphilus]MDT2815159.1 plasmid pRiA4b ORF-3 family protein [Vagococcus carniphilus]MDT2863812.1 plasmid pRiA4b ORF-3 family protein [Vagococcus carniphilus]